MIMTVTNTSATVTLNALGSISVGSGTSATYATGGARVNQLPFPFSHTTIAPSAAVALGVRPRDMARQKVADSLSPATQWNQLVQAGTVTVAMAKEATSTDVEELAFDTV